MKTMRYLMVLCTIFSIYSCSSDDTTSITPSITISDISRYDVVVNGIIPMNEDTEIEECGLYWSYKNEKPTDMDNRVIAEYKNGKFQVKLAKLAGGTTYYVRGYAKNRTVTDISETVQFTTSKGVPEITASGLGFPNAMCSVRGDIGCQEIKEIGYCRILSTNSNENVIPSIENCERRDIVTPYVSKGPQQGSSPLFSFSLEAKGDNLYFHTRVYVITAEGIGYSNKFVYYTGNIR